MSGTRHGMIPGTHEWPRTPECFCGYTWDRWAGKCSAQMKAEQGEQS